MEAEKAEENGHNTVDRLVGNVIEVAEARFDIVAINIQEKMTEIMGSVATVAAVGLLLVFTLLLLSIGAAMFLSEYSKSAFIGFSIVAAFYLLAAVVLYINRYNWIKLPIINALLKKINFHEEN